MKYNSIVSDNLNGSEITQQISTKLALNLWSVSFSSVIDRCLFHPLDNIITIQQTKGFSLSYTVKLVYNQPHKLYAGFKWSLFSSIPIRVSTYSTYFIARDALCERFNMPTESSRLAAAAFSGLAESIVLFPSDLHRSRRLAGANFSFSMIGKFKGFTPLFSRLVLENTIGLVGAEKLTEFMNCYTAALISGMASQIISAPFDKFKSQIMVSCGEKSMHYHLTAFFKEKDFFRALPLKMVRAGLCNSVVFGTASLITSKLKNRT